MAAADDGDDDDDDDGGEWNARAAGAAMARSRAIDAAARKAAFVGVLAMLLLMVGNQFSTK